jgi:hypothetical protein
METETEPDNIKMDRRIICCEGANWIGIPRDKFQWQNVVTVMILRAQ